MVMLILTGSSCAVSGAPHKAGPGVGVRLNNTWQPPKSSPIRYTQDIVVDKEVTKKEKIRTLLAGPNTNIGKSGVELNVRPSIKKAWLAV